MDREGRKRYFIFGSAILEIVAPVFKHRLDNECKIHGNGTLQAFMNKQPVIHTMFHLRHRYVWCCVDKPNCTNNSMLPLNSNQWKCLYAENPGSHHCHCKYTAKPIQLDDLDLTLAGLILVNCCNLSPADVDAVKTLRQYRNDYFAHNTDGTISQADYDRLWPYLTTYILQLDNSRQDELTRIKNRPLDEPLCNKYATLLVDVHTRLDEIDTSVQGNNNLLQGNNALLQGHTTLIQGNNELLQGHTTLLQGNNELLQTMNTNMQTLLFYAQRGMTCKCYQEHTNDQVIRSKKPYKLGQTIFSLHHQTDHQTDMCDRQGYILDGVMMDDGRLVLCLCDMYRLLICNTDVSEVDSIQLQYQPCDVTAVNNSTVAVTLCGSECIEMYDINNKHKLKSIEVPRMRWRRGITTINNKLVLCRECCLYIIDHQTGEMIQTIDIGNCYPRYLHTSGDRIFYCGVYSDNKLYCYNYTENKVTKKSLPSEPRRITSLQDGSLYVRCQDGSVQHVSSDGQHYKPVTTEGLKSLESDSVISYNTKQRKLLTCIKPGTINIYREE